MMEQEKSPPPGPGHRDSPLRSKRTRGRGGRGFRAAATTYFVGHARRRWRVSQRYVVSVRELCEDDRSVGAELAMSHSPIGVKSLSRGPLPNSLTTLLYDRLKQHRLHQQLFLGTTTPQLVDNSQHPLPRHRQPLHELRSHPVDNMFNLGDHIDRLQELGVRYLLVRIR